MQYFGFFEELPHGHMAGGRLADLVRTDPQPHEGRILEYLEAGQWVAATPGLARDVLADDARPSAAPHVLTDGRWIWPGDLQYYVARYHVLLPAEFLASMEANGWTVPAISDSRIHEIVQCLLRERRGDTD